VLFYTGLWTIKLSFFDLVQTAWPELEESGNCVWWAVMVITVATYFASLGTIEYHCFAGLFSYLESKYHYTYISSNTN